MTRNGDGDGSPGTSGSGERAADAYQEVSPFRPAAPARSRRGRRPPGRPGLRGAVWLWWRHSAAGPAGGGHGRGARASLGHGLCGAGRAVAGSGPVRAVAADPGLHTVGFVAAADRWAGRLDRRPGRDRHRATGRRRPQTLRVPGRPAGPAGRWRLPGRSARAAGVGRRLLLPRRAHRLHPRGRGGADRRAARQAVRPRHRRTGSHPAAGRGHPRAARAQRHHDGGRGLLPSARHAQCRAEVPAMQSAGPAVSQAQP